MQNRRPCRTLLQLIVGAIAVGWTAPAIAHGPDDITSRLTVRADRMEIVTTLGLDIARQLLIDAGVSEENVKKSLRALGPDDTVTQPSSVSEQLFRLTASDNDVRPRQVISRCEGMELVLTTTYPRPTPGALILRAVAYEQFKTLRPGALMAFAEPNLALGGALLTAEKPDLTLAIPTVEARAPR